MNGCIYRTEFDVCKKYTTDKATSFCVGRNCLDRKPSNSDRIRAMTDEELSYYLDGLAGDGCPPQMSPVCNKERYKCNVRKCWLEWLKQESGES